MYRATTPKHVFYFNVDPESSFKTILITYSQNGKIVVEKTKEDLTFETDEKGNYIAWLRLSQEEANSFYVKWTSANSAGAKILIQVRALSYADEAFASQKFEVPVEDVLNDEVLV